MTLKIRNRLLKFFFNISLLSLAVSLFFFIYSLVNGTILMPPDYRIPSVLSRLPFTQLSFPATMMSFVFTSLYVPVVLFFLSRYFGNTQSSEIIFFSAFILGVFFEISRFYTIIFGVWQTYTNLLIFLGNMVLFGRLLTPVSFVCAAIFSEISQRQDIERNYLLMTVAAFICALLIPMNTARISSTGFVTEGFMTHLVVIRLLLISLATISFFIRGIKHSSNEYKILAFAQLILYFGYMMLISADNYVFLIFGLLQLYGGTYFYLKTLHRMYMWI